MRLSAVIFSAVLISLFALEPAMAARSFHAPLLRHQRSHEESQTPQAPAEIREVKNNFFSISLPEGWKTQRAIHPASDRVSAEFMKDKLTRVSLNIFKSPFDGKTMAQKLAENMRKRGMEVSEPVEQDGLYVVEISKKGVNGKGWFGNADGMSASTIIFAPNLAEANELLEALHPATPGIVPKKVD